MGTSIFSSRHLLLAGPRNRLGLEAMLLGGFTRQEKVDHMSSFPQGDVLWLQTWALISGSFFALGFL